MKLSALIFLSLFSITLLLACQTEPKIEYVKYVNEAAVPRISVEEAKKEYDAGRAVFVDSRGQTAFDAEHLPGAVVIPYENGQPKYEALPKGKKIIVYCS